MVSFIKSESYKKGVIFSSIFNIGSKSIAFFQQLLLGYYFGANAETDIFFFTYNIILFISFFFLNLTTSVLIPEAMRLRHQENEENSMKFLNSFILLYTCCGVLLFIILALNTSSIFTTISSFSFKDITKHIDLIFYCLPLITLNIIVNLFTEILASYKYFTIPNIVNMINYTIGVLFIFLFHNSLGISSIVLGLSIGYIINLFFVIIFLQKVTQWNFFLFDFKKIRPILSNSLYTQSGHCIYLFSLYIPQYIFSSFSKGTLTSVNYAEKVLNIPGIFLIGQIVNVAGIKLNNLISEKKTKEAFKFTQILLFKIGGGLTLVALLISIFSYPLIKLLFDHGNFQLSALELTSQLLSILILFLPFTFEYSIIIKLLQSAQKLKYVFIIQFITQGLTIAFYFLFLQNNNILNYPLCKITPYVITVFALIPFIKTLFSDLAIKRLLIYQLILTLVLTLYLIACLNIIS